MGYNTVRGHPKHQTGEDGGGSLRRTDWHLEVKRVVRASREVALGWAWALRFANRRQRDWLINSVRGSRGIHTLTTLSSFAFPYEEIDASTQYRVLELRPGTFNDTLQGALIPVSLEHNSPGSTPYFNAVSYHWGPPAAYDYILCNGAKLPIAKNVSKMLRRFRRLRDARYLWIDAVCINQSNKKEKTAQVQVMHEIYKRSAQTLIWLGDDDRDTAPAFNVVNAAMESLVSSGCERPTRENFGHLLESGFPSSADPRWKNLNSILRRPWFQRTWILQEVALASCSPVVQCGRYHCFWVDLAHISILMCICNAYQPVVAPYLEDAAFVAFVAFRAPAYVDHSLSGLLLATNSKLVSDQRDKVFALLGIASDAGDFKHLVDYTKSVRTIYTEVAVTYLRCGKSDILNSAGDSAWRAERALPSWVPDWSANNFSSTASRPHTLGYGLRRRRLEFGEPSFSTDRLVLHIQGIIVDLVQDVGLNLKPRLNLTEFKSTRTFQRWYRLVAGSKLYFTGEPLDEAFARTLVLDRVDPSTGPFENVADIYEAYAERITNKELCPDRLQTAEDVVVSQYADALFVTCCRRSFYTTRSGYMGLGSYFLRPGDLLIELHQGITPFAIRPVKGGKYKLVGEAYIHGKMDLEGMNVDSNAVREFQLV